MRRYLTGAFYHGCFAVGIVWAMEVAPGTHMLIMNLSTHWFAGYVFAGIIGYVTRQWRVYLWVLNIFGTPIIAFYAWTLVESPRWLVQKGRLGRVRVVFSAFQTDSNRLLARYDTLAE
jgi:hypothetical protein